MRFHRFALTFARSVRTFSDNVTYSGGQAIVGQGGYYGSGGSRASSIPSSIRNGQINVLASAEDVRRLAALMSAVEKLEQDLNATQDNEMKTSATKADLYKIMRSEATGELVRKLWYAGQPVWGLTKRERDFVRWASEAYWMEICE